MNISSSKDPTTPSILDFLSPHERHITNFVQLTEGAGVRTLLSDKPTVNGRQASDMCCRKLTLHTGEATALHRHHDVSKIYIGILGFLEVVWIDRLEVFRRETINLGNVCRVPRGCWHAIRGLAGAGAEIVCIVVTAENPDRARMEWESRTIDELNALVAGMRVPVLTYPTTSAP